MENGTRHHRQEIDAGYLGLILSGARQKGLDCDRILARVGIDPALLSDGRGRLSQLQFARLISLLTRITQDEIWLLSHRPIKPGTFRTMCRLLVPCEDLRGAIQAGCRFYHLITDDFTVRLQTGSGEACLWITDRIDDPEQRRTVHGIVMFFIYGLMCWLVGRKLPLTTVHYASEHRPISSELEPFYDAPMFSAMPAANSASTRRCSICRSSPTRSGCSDFSPRCPASCWCDIATKPPSPNAFAAFSSAT